MCRTWEVAGIITEACCELGEAEEWSERNESPGRGWTIARQRPDFLVSIATGAGSYQPLPFKPASGHGWGRIGIDAEAIRTSHLHTHPARCQWHQPRSWLCQVSGGVGAGSVMPSLCRHTSLHCSYCRGLACNHSYDDSCDDSRTEVATHIGMLTDAGKSMHLTKMCICSSLPLYSFFLTGDPKMIFYIGTNTSLWEGALNPCSFVQGFVSTKPFCTDRLGQMLPYTWSICKYSDIYKHTPFCLGNVCSHSHWKIILYCS